MVFNIFTSGQFKKNTSAYGVVIFNGREKIDEISEITTEESDYCGILKGLEYLEKKQEKAANFFIDSKRLVNALKDNNNNNSLFLKIKEKLKILNINFLWIPETENKQAKTLAMNLINKTIKESKFESPSNLIFEKAFFGKINCLKIQLSKEKEIYFHLGLLKSGVWDWKKVKMSDVEIGEMIYLLKKEEGKCAFYHKWANGKTQIWCNKGDKGFNVKIDEVSKNLSIGETEVLRILLEECLRRGC